MAADPTGSLAIIGVFTITPPAGGGAAVNVYGVDNLTLPDQQSAEDTFTPIQGTLANKEQVFLAAQKSGKITCTLTWDADNDAALRAVQSVNACTISLPFTATKTLSATGAVQLIGVSQFDGSKRMVSNLSISVNAGWTIA